MNKPNQQTLLDDKAALVYHVPVHDRIIYFSEIRLNVTSFNFDKITSTIENELKIRQEAFLNISTISESKHLVGVLFFNPKLLSRQLRIYIQEEISGVDNFYKYQYRLRIGLSIELDANQGPKYSIELAIEKQTDKDPWLSQGSLFNSFYTPKLVPGIQELKNTHPVKDTFSFIFPASALKSTKFKNFLGPKYEPVIKEEAIATKQEIIEHYKQYADDIMLPLIINHYEHGQEIGAVTSVLSYKEIRKQWDALRNKLLTYIDMQFTRLNEYENNNPNSYPSGLISVLLHYPSIKGKNNKFIVLEYVNVEKNHHNDLFTAITVELSGPVLDGHHHELKNITSTRTQ